MQASTQTPYGKLAAKWTAESDVLKTLEVEIPVNTTAEIHVPASSLEIVKSANALKPVGYEDGYAKFEVGSGKYSFAVQ
jgi:alpha-L-rhamnosidase